MNTTRGRRAGKVLRSSVAGAVAGVSAAALLFAGAGTAHASADPVTFTNQAGTVQVIYSGDAFSLFATIVDAGNPAGVTEVCRYHAAPVLGTVAFPHDNSVFVTGANPSVPMWILVPQWQRSWSVTVTCDGTGNTATYSPVVY